MHFLGATALAAIEGEQLDEREITVVRLVSDD